MKRLVVILCVCAAGCGTQNSPVSPSSAGAATDGRGVPGSSTRAQYAIGLRFEGTFTGHSAAVFNCPPVCPPTSFTSRGTYEGTATHLGRFTAAFADVIDIATATATGTIDFTAADGDRLYTTTAGGEEAFTPPNIGSVRLLATVTGGTGRFAGATGTLTVRFVQEIDFANGTSEIVSGSLEGVIDLNK